MMGAPVSPVISGIVYNSTRTIFGWVNAGSAKSTMNKCTYSSTGNSTRRLLPGTAKKKIQSTNISDDALRKDVVSTNCSGGVQRPV
jgi:hypothetical protein